MVIKEKALYSIIRSSSRISKQPIALIVSTQAETQQFFMKKGIINNEADFLRLLSDGYANGGMLVLSEKQKNKERWFGAELGQGMFAHMKRETLESTCITNALINEYAPKETTIEFLDF